MTLQIKSNGFTPAAQAAAQKSRKLKSEAEGARSGSPTIFAVRVGTAFGWEARKYGGVIVDRSESLFDTPDLARMAGNQATSAPKA